MLQGLMPRLMPQTLTCRYIVFEGKHDLEKQLVRKLRGYQVPAAKFIVMRDKDAAKCTTIKKKLLAKCCEAGKPEALVRIACHELESWYLADLAAVEKGLGITGLTRYQSNAPFSDPDRLPLPSATLRKIAPTYQKVGGSRSIGPYLELENKRSNSFKVFVEGIRKVCAS